MTVMFPYLLASIGKLHTLEWWRLLQLRMRGFMPPWSPKARALPVSAFADIYPAWEASMSNPRQPMTEEDRLNMISYHHLAYLNLREGVASSESWGCLALASNLCLILAELGYGEEWIPLAQEAQDALMRADARGQAGNAWRMDGRGLATVSDMLDVFDAQLEIAPRMAITRAREIILERMAAHEVLELERG